MPSVQKRVVKIPQAGFRREQLADRYGLSAVAIDRAWRRGDLPRPIFIGRIPYWPESVVADFESKKRK